MAPDFDRLAFSPWPVASLASSGTSFFSSTLALSCSWWATWVRRKADSQFRPAVGRAHVDGSNRLQPRPWRLDPEQARGFAALHAAPELLLRGDQQVLVQRVGMDGQFDPLAAPGDDRQHRGSWLVTHILC